MSGRVIDVGERARECRLPALVQRLPGQDLEQDRAQRIDVGRSVGRGGVAQLLGRHVPRSAEHVTRLRLALARCEIGDAREIVGFVEHAREPPVEHVDLAVLAEHDVRGLEVAMDDAAAVSEGDPAADVDERVQQRLERIRGESIQQCHAGEPLHDEVRPALGIVAELVHGHDRRVIEPSLDPRFPEEPRDGVLRRIRRPHSFNGDIAADVAIARE